MANDLTKMPASAAVAQRLVDDGGVIDVRTTARTLGMLVNEVLTGSIQTSRARTAIMGIRALVALADAVRRSGDAAQSMLHVLPADAAIDVTPKNKR